MGHSAIYIGTSSSALMVEGEMLLNLKSNINRNIAKRVLGSSLKKTKRAKTDMPKLFSCQKSIPLLSELLMKRIESVMGFGYKWIKFIEKSG